MEGKVFGDGNIIGRIGAAAAIIATAVLVARVCGQAGKICPLGGECAAMSAGPAAPAAPSKSQPAKP